MWSFYVLPHSYLELTLGVNLSVNGCPTDGCGCTPPLPWGSWDRPRPLTTLNVGYLNSKWKFNEICSSFLSGNLDAKSDFCSVLKENAANVIKVVRTTHN